MNYTWGIPGPTFLAVYTVLLVFPLIIGLLWTIAAKLARKVPRAAVSGPQPTTYELAYLAGGPDRVVDTAIAALVERGTLRVSSSKQLQLTGPEPADPIERAVARSARPGHKSTTRGIRDRLRMSGPMQALARDLEARGLAVAEKASRIHQVVSFLYVAVLALGVVRVFAGISGDHPVAFLIPLVIVAAFATLIAQVVKSKSKSTGPRPTSEGKQVLHRAKSAHGRERKRGVSPGPAMAGAAGGAMLGGAAVAVALGGLAFYPDEELSAALIPPPVPGGFGGGGSSGGSTCSAGSSSCGSGGSGGGGGGCGGGGCGG